MATTDEQSKKNKVAERTIDDELSEIQEETVKVISTASSNLSATEVKSELLDKKLSDMKKMMNKMYALQKRMVVGEKVRRFS